MDRRRDGVGTIGGDGFQPCGGCGYRRAECANEDAASAGRTADRGFRVGLLVAARRWCFCSRRGALNPLCLRLAPVALAVRVRSTRITKRFTSFVAYRARVRAWDRARGGMDRDSRFSRSAHSVADRRRHILDRGVRHHLLVPGLRVRPERRLVQPAAAARHCGRAVDCRGCFTSECSSAWWRWCRRLRSEPVASPVSAVVAALLLWEHRLVHADDLSRVDAAFFTVNGWVSVLFFLFWTADVFCRHVVRNTMQLQPIIDDPRLKSHSGQSRGRRAA